MLQRWSHHLLRVTPKRHAVIPVPGKWVKDAEKLKRYFRDHEGFWSYYTRKDTIGRTAQLGWGKPELDAIEIRKGVKMVFEQVVNLLDRQEWTKLKALFGQEEISQIHAQTLIDAWKAASKSDQELLGQSILDSISVTSSAFKRVRTTDKTVIAHIYMRCMVIGVIDTLPEGVKNSDSAELQKMVQNHNKLMKENGRYYVLFYIEMKHHFGTQDKHEFIPGNQEWELHQIQSWSF